MVKGVDDLVAQGHLRADDQGVPGRTLTRETSGMSVVWLGQSVICRTMSKPSRLFHSAMTCPSATW